MSRRFPIEGGLSVSWESAERAYEYYNKIFGQYQTLEKIAQRGGFGMYEFAALTWKRNPYRPGEPRISDEWIVQALREGDVKVGS